jgi:dolichyl-diphosphooligosaccharide--protein glycosyltransferase
VAKRTLLIPVGLFVLALVVRLLPWPTTIENGRVIFFGMDAWYHMRRVQLVLANGGWPPAFDPYVNFPDGASPIWSPFFDAVVGWIVWPLHATGEWFVVEAAAALLPPILGAACVVVLYALAKRLFDPVVAGFAGLFLSVLSAHFWYSQIGFLDHHVAVALLSTGLLASGMGLLERPVWSRAWGVGVLAGAGLLLWPGMLLHVGLVELGLLVAMVASEDARARAGSLAWTNGVALAVVLPACLSPNPGWSAFSPAVLSFFQPWLFLAGVLLPGACALLWSRSSAGSRVSARGGQALAIGLVIAVGSFLAVPDLLVGVGEAWRWLGKDEVFQSLVRESKPLFLAKTGVDAWNAELRLSRLLYFLPVALIALVLHARRSQKRAQLLLLVGWTVVLAVLTLLQRRFFNSLSPAFALVLAWGGVTAWRRRPESLRNGAAGLAAAGLALAVVLFGLWPTLRSYRLPLQNLRSAAVGATMSLPATEISRRVLMDTADWLRENTPPTAAPLDPEAVPEYGVLAAWGYGHLLKYLAQRPTVVGNFGDDVGEANFRRVHAYFASREPNAVRLLDALRVRYVLVRTLGDVPAQRLVGDAMRKRLSVDDSPGLEHHRLVYESGLAGEHLEAGRSEFRIFERVEGARLVGRAPPGARVTASLVYQSNRGRRGRQRSATQADAAGRYEFRLPHSSRGGGPGIRSEGAYLVQSGGSTASVVVEESAVRSGAFVTGPDFP